MENTPASCTSSAMNTTLMNGFTSNTSRGIQIGVTHSIGIGVSDPSHLTFASSHVGSGYVNAGSQKGFFGQFNSETPSDSFQFTIRVFLGINANASFATAEGYIDAGALVGHQSGQGLNFISIDIQTTK